MAARGCSAIPWERRLVGTWLGRLVIHVRDQAQLVGAVLKRPWVAETLINDSLAGRISARLCREGMTFLDVGAHIGSVIDAVKRSCPRSRVVAFEAIPEKVAHLHKRFPDVDCHACALGELDGEVSFFVNPVASGYSSLGGPHGPDAAASIEIRVPMRRLDGFGNLGKVDVIKIDVEGAELGVLRGGEQVIQTHRPVIVFESGPRTLEGLGYTKEAMWTWLTERSYAVLVPNRLANEDSGLSLDGFSEAHRFPRRTTNYFAVPQERLDDVRQRARQILGLKRVDRAGV
ncbi:MAG: hypothetical protein KatS3mg108_1139 [Isosphaeraceae bacterium]|jgi:FkbM family methyltransferase|nr:MAG: hypothetical protein KatS3mg108_1139 [Isosphaeraceae bacterium]